MCGVAGGAASVPSSVRRRRRAYGYERTASRSCPGMTAETTHAGGRRRSKKGARISSATMSLPHFGRTWTQMGVRPHRGTGQPSTLAPHPGSQARGFLTGAGSVSRITLPAGVETTPWHVVRSTGVCAVRHIRKSAIRRTPDPYLSRNFSRILRRRDLRSSPAAAADAALAQQRTPPAPEREPSFGRRGLQAAPRRSWLTITPKGA